MKNSLAQENGNVVVTAILLLSVMLGLGLAVASQVDTQTGHSRTERERESSFNLAEASLSAQTFILGRRGTGIESRPHPAEGCPASGDTYFCPDEERLMRNYEGAGQIDFGPDTEWSTHVLDDADAFGNPMPFWKDEYLGVQDWPRYDKNANHLVWVRAEATVRGDKRAIVALAQVEERVVPFPRYAILAGYVEGKNSGGHGGRPLVDSTGSLGVGVRCNQPPQSPCIDLDPTKGPQLHPPRNYQLGYQGSAIGSQDLFALEEVAKANGTWYESCPSNPNGDVVYVKNAGACRYTNGAPPALGGVKCCNLESNPGLFILERGSVDFGGNIEFWGVVYHANLDNSANDRLVETSGTSTIYGGVIVDGDGGVYAGSSGNNIVYKPFAFDDIKAFGTAGVVQNTWHEIVPPDGG
jgi:hypothetical protein